MLDDRQILNIVGQELSNASGGNENDFLESNRQAAMATYLGQKYGNEVEGRSSVVSTDVADAIEWIMPEVVKAFTQNNEVVTFDPVGEGDEKQAELESEFVYSILMKENDGFIILHEFFKDALMQKNGFIKVFYEKEEIITSESYTSMTEQEFNVVASDPEVELVELTINEDGEIPIYDFKVNRIIKNNGTRIICVPPEEFRINEMHNSVSLTNARFCAHVHIKTAGELVQGGLDKGLVDSLPSYSEYDDSREYRFYMQGESVDPGAPLRSDPAARLIEISECYLNLDIKENGDSQLYKVNVVGNTVPTTLIDYEPIDGNPFISSTAILMSHKLFGLSIYDRLREIQEQKTALWRSILDNTYLQNNQRTVVVENQVNIDDLLVSRPGGIIRSKRPDAVAPLVTPPLSPDAYKMMDYLDQVRTARSGVTPEAPIQDSMVGDRVGSEGIDKMMTQREELVGLMIRVFAETGIKPLCYRIREQLIKHQDYSVDYKFKGNWVSVDPSKWRNRKNTTVRVGTGSGDRKSQSAALAQIIAMQEKALAVPGQSLVKESGIYKAVNDLAKLSGLSGASSYFVDPESDEGKKFKQEVDQKNQQAQQAEAKQEASLAEAQTMIAKAEEIKAKANATNVQLKNEVDTAKNQLVLQKQEYEVQVKMLEQQLKEAEIIGKSSKDAADLEFKYYDADQRAEIERLRIKEASENNSDSESSDEE